MFEGNPGTGKTATARLIGEIYRDVGLLKRGHLVEVKAPDLISEHVGGSSTLLNARLDEALDGILFIDEAHQLNDEGHRSFGQNVVRTLVGRMEDERQRLAVIVAGYPAEMEKFLDMDPGLRSRFSEHNTIFFPDYAPDELNQILFLMLKRDTISADRRPR